MKHISILWEEQEFRKMYQTEPPEESYLRCLEWFVLQGREAAAPALTTAAWLKAEIKETWP